MFTVNQQRAMAIETITDILSRDLAATGSEGRAIHLTATDREGLLMAARQLSGLLADFSHAESDQRLIGHAERRAV